MEHNSFVFQSTVQSQWVDYNGHMNDAAYAKAFSLAVDAFMDFIGLDEDAREKHAYTIFTLETHLCYLQEANEGEELQVFAQLLDVDDKRIHIFFTMKNNSGDIIATSEQMLMGIDTKEGKAASFPSPISTTIEKLSQSDKQVTIPKQVGRTIGIRR
ncbi:thioesterase family protein [Sporosarcina jiandibaonis]|uniref:thioesterase family protein n=1 Tax=Sporosarcina jiandibaonis TaxID=2715535 RepID=UPI001552A3F7|nr:thioesterase family protein [Sporosarcina jiandibaonis]